MMQLPVVSPAQQAAQANFASRAFHPGSPMVPSSSHTTTSGPTGANTQWVEDFQRMQLNSQAPRYANGSGNSIREELLQRGITPTSVMENPTLFDRETMRRVFEVQQQQSLRPAMSTNGAQLQNLLLNNQMEDFMRCAPDGAVLPSSVPSRHYPKELELAATSEEALEAAFAAYDEDFQAEMDQWVETHPPTGLDEARRETFMSEFEWEQNWKQETDFLVDNSPNRDALAQKQRKVQEDRKLQQAALETLRAVNNGEQKSAELQEKIQNSTFVGLLGRLSSGEIAIDGNDLFDNVKGETIDPGQESDARHATTLLAQGEGIQNGMHANADDKGKGKEKAKDQDSREA